MRPSASWLKVLSLWHPAMQKLSHFKQKSRFYFCCVYLFRLFQNYNFKFFFPAASCDHFDIVEYLLEHNADPTAVDADGETPLVCAESEKIKQLLQDSIRETCLKTT